jgi:hypothetical protein
MAATAAGLMSAAPQHADPHRLAGLYATLANQFGFTESERHTLAGGFEVARALPSSAPDGLAAIGAIWIDARPSVYLNWAESFADFDRGSSVQAVRKLSPLPVPSDFSTLTLSRDELRELERCRVGACTLQLDGDRATASSAWR